MVIIGGGDTGADCLGTAHRQGALSVTQLDYNPEPPEVRDESRIAMADVAAGAAHLAGPRGRRSAALSRSPCSGSAATSTETCEPSRSPKSRSRRDADGRRVITPVGDSLELPCDLALLAIGFEGVEHMPLLDELGLELNRRGALPCGPDWQTAAPGVFVCGDAHRGASLIVWAIAEGRSAAHAVDAYLMGESDLPAPVRPSALPLAVV